MTVCSQDVTHNYKGDWANVDFLARTIVPID
jgi:hypothetical protein